MSDGRDVDFDEEILRPVLESEPSLCQLVSHEWERAMVHDTAALRMNRTFTSGRASTQRWNNTTSV